MLSRFNHLITHNVYAQFFFNLLLSAFAFVVLDAITDKETDPVFVLLLGFINTWLFYKQQELDLNKE